MVSAWAESNSLVFGQFKVEDKGNEIAAMPRLLRALELAGCIVMVDEMGRQKKTDVCFREDQSRACRGYAAENLATLRRLALNLLRQEKTKMRGIKGKRLNDGWDHANLLPTLGI